MGCFALRNSAGIDNEHAGSSIWLHFGLIGVFVAPEDDHHRSENDPQIQI